MKLSFNPVTFYTLQVWADVLNYKHGLSSVCVAYVFDWVNYKTDDWFGAHDTGLGDDDSAQACGIDNWGQIEPQVAAWITVHKNKTWDELPHMVRAG